MASKAWAFDRTIKPASICSSLASRSRMDSWTLLGFFRCLLVLGLLSFAHCTSHHRDFENFWTRGRHFDRSPHQQGLRSRREANPAFAFRIGVNYGRVADNLLPPAQVAQLISKATTIRRVKIFDADASVLNAFAKTNISLIVCVPNALLPDFAADAAKSLAWANTSIAPFVPATRITHIAVGNEILAQGDSSLTAALVPAIANLHSSLRKLGLDGAIKVSSPHSFGVLASSSPPSNGRFLDSISTAVMRPHLEFLNRTGAPFMVNVYPYFAYSGSGGNIPLEYAVFKPNGGVIDTSNGLNYTSLFAAQIDAVRSAMAALGFDRVRILVAESGWPSHGGDGEVGASLENARDYITGLARHVNYGLGTPLRPTDPIDVFIFALFNEDQKPGPTSERNFGLFDPTGVPIYNAGMLLFKKRIKDRVFLYNRALTKQWCVAKPGAEPEALQRGISFACAEGGVDCSPILVGGACFSPENAFSHASFVYNSYFQKLGRNPWNCYFQDTAIITISDPSYGSCPYTSPQPHFNSSRNSQARKV